MKQILILSILLLFSSASEADGLPSIDWHTPIPVAVIRSDFDELYTRLKRAHVDLYTHRRQADYDAMYNKMRKAMVAPMSLYEVQIMFQKFMAYGNVAHSKIDFPDPVYQQFRSEGGRIFPIFLRIIGEAVYVAENYSTNSAIKIGDELISLNGKPMSHWIELTSEHISADIPYIAHSLLEFMFPKYLWLVLGEYDEFELMVKRDGNAPVKHRVAAQTQQQMQKAAAERPASFSLSMEKRVAKMLDSKIAYLRPGPFYNIEDVANVWDETAFVRFVDAAYSDFIQQSAKTLIIDLRANPGGNNSFSDPMLAWIADKPFRFASEFLIKSSSEAAASNQQRLDTNPGSVSGISGVLAQKYREVPHGELFDFEIPFVKPKKDRRFDGEVYVLIDRHSYSNAVNVAAIVQDYGFGTIVGEKTSDMATTYGAMETFKLTGSNITVSFPKAHIIRPSGERKSDGVSPDIVIKTPLGLQHNDVVLNRLLEILNAK